MTIPTRPYLTEAQAREILDAAAAEARAKNWPVTVAVVDDGGHLLALQRLEGASPASAHIATGKARTAAVGRRDSKFYEDMLSNRLAFLSAPGLDCLLEGGLAILLGGSCVGGIGVSGVKSHEDAEVARSGLEALQPG
jgi:glc operon protein GlcG